MGECVLSQRDIAGVERIDQLPRGQDQRLGGLVEDSCQLCGPAALVEDAFQLSHETTSQVQCPRARRWKRLLLLGLCSPRSGSLVRALRARW